jgi:hypothetical protein
VPGLLLLFVPSGAPAGTYRVALAFTQPGTLNVTALTFKSFVVVP